MWIAFILYLCFVDNSFVSYDPEIRIVVNCFHFVSLLCWQQSVKSEYKNYFCCELLSFCIFALLTTVINETLTHGIVLWIAFILYLCFVDNSITTIVKKEIKVVNCFHFVSLLCWQQYEENYKYLNLVVNCFHFVSLLCWQQFHISKWLI